MFGLPDRLIRKAAKIVPSPITDLPSKSAHPECDALLAMMLFHAARFESRTNAAGELLLQQQDRGRWDKPEVGRGLLHLEQAAGGERLTSYHRQAEIGAIHAISKEFKLTNWKHNLSLYDLLMVMQPTPVVAINRAIRLVAGRRPGDRAGSTEGHPFQQLPRAVSVFADVDVAVNLFPARSSSRALNRKGALSNQNLALWPPIVRLS